jgi:hypothetical protein
MNNTHHAIAAITTVRNDDLFLPKWIAHYGQAFGYKNLFVILDGHDQTKPDCLGADQVNFICLPFQPLKRSAGDRRRARIMSQFARGLFWLYKTVLAMDVDEFLIVDPNTNTTLAEYLANRRQYDSLSALGLDVGQHQKLESTLNPQLPFLSQRQYAHLSSRYTKPIVTNKPLTWGSGMHRIKGRNYRIDPNLYLIHLGMVDIQRCMGDKSNQELVATGWSGHLDRRYEIFDIIANSTPKNWDEYIPTARRNQQFKRQLLAWNKPALLKNKPVVKLPERFQNLL